MGSVCFCWRLTVEDLDSDGLLLLDGLSAWEACIADVVIPGVFSAHVGKVQVPIQGLGHSRALRQLLEV